MTEPIAAVAFDLGGVVFRYRPERRLDAFARATGRSPAALQKALIDSGYARSCDAGRLTGEAAYREGSRLLGQRLGFGRFRSTWIEAFEPDPGVVALVRRLRERLPVAMLTNNSDLVRSGLEARDGEVMELFRPRVFSADTGMLKPDPRLYRTLLDLLEEPPERVLYVDDEPACTAAAEALGMPAHRFESAAGLQALLSSQGLL
ncbi:MAG TPA: HAD family phosphatase [Pseudomonadales bacterium]